MTTNARPPIGPKYDLDRDEFDALEAELVDTARGEASREGLSAVWLGPGHRYANIIRTHEARLFPEVHDSSAGDESKTLFLALVDTRAASGRVVHGATVCGPGALAEGSSGASAAVSTGFITIDNLIELGNFSADEFESYYTSRNIDLTRSLSVETNFRIGKRVPNAWGLSTSTIAYLMLFRFLVRRGARRNRALVFADVNRVSRISFQRTGIMYAPLMGRTDLVTPEAALGRFSFPVTIPIDDACHDLFLSMRAEIPEVFLGVDAVLCGATNQMVPGAAEVGS
jgi:hypothetical protein